MRRHPPAPMIVWHRTDAAARAMTAPHSVFGRTIMDGRRFDDATRALANGVSRRGVLRGLIGGTLGGMLALANHRDGLGAPRCKALGKRCKTTADCCPE